MISMHMRSIANHILALCEDGSLYHIKNRYGLTEKLPASAKVIEYELILSDGSRHFHSPKSNAKLRRVYRRDRIENGWDPANPNWAHTLVRMKALRKGDIFRIETDNPKDHLHGINRFMVATSDPYQEDGVWTIGTEEEPSLTEMDGSKKAIGKARVLDPVSVAPPKEPNDVVERRRGYSDAKSGHGPAIFGGAYMVGYRRGRAEIGQPMSHLPPKETR